jgi:transposase InsO family protein
LASRVCGARSTTSSPPSTTAPGSGCYAPTRAATKKTAIAFIDDVMAKLPFAVERVQTDHGSEFGASFHWHLLDAGVDHVKIKPRTPRLNGKVERSHRIDSEEFYRLLAGQVIDDANLFAEKLQEWEDYYNYHRPHGALNGQTPYERLRQKTQGPLS